MLIIIKIKVIGFIIEIIVDTAVHYTEHVAVMGCVSNFRIIGIQKICI